MENRCVCCGEIIPEGIQVCPNCEELAFRSSLWRLFREHLINQYSVFISSEVDKAVKEAYENGITDYMSWIKWVAGGKKKGARKNAKPKRSGAGSDVAEKQNGRKRHTGRAKRGSDV